MVGINRNFAPNYQVQTKKVAAQDEGKNQQQTQQAETQAVKQPTVPTLQQPTVKVPLSTWQANVGIKPEQPQKPEQPDAKPTRHLGTAPDDDKKQREWLLSQDPKKGDTLVLNGNVYIIDRIFIDDNGGVRFELHILND